MSLTDNLDEQQARLAVLRASEAELTDGADAALAVLGAPTDSIRLRAAIGFLLRADRHTEAGDLIRDREPDDKWIDFGALTHARNGDLVRATSFLARADDLADRDLMRRTRVAFAEGIVDKWHAQHDPRSLLAIESWDVEERTLARQVCSALEPVLSLVRANRRISGEIELGAVQYALIASHIGLDALLSKECATWLFRHVPIPLLTAEMCLLGLHACPPNLPTRLRLEHPREFQPALLAALVERELLSQPAKAFDSLLALANDANTDDARRSVSMAIVETSGHCSPPRVDEAVAIVQKLQPPGSSRILGLLSVFKCFANRDLVAAAVRLQDIRDETDSIWWQAYAQLLEAQGHHDQAVSAWLRASELLPHPELVRRSAQVALDRKRYQLAVQGLEKLVAKSTAREEDLKALAWALVRLGDYAKAAAHLKRLVEIAPSDEYRLGLAQCLARSMHTEEAIAVLQPLCDNDAPVVEAVFLQSELHTANGNAEAAFEVLDVIAGDHWDDPRFITQYMHRAYAAGLDRSAGEAFVRLTELSREGKVPAELMQKGTLEQLLEYGKEFRTRREGLQDMVVRGRMPWLAAEDLLGNAPVWAWTLHTQDLHWISEEPLSHAANTVYATNGFAVASDPQSRRLEAIASPTRGKDVVTDLSALITLHQLGILAEAAEFCGRLVIPASYGDIPIRDSTRLGQHQPSRYAELKAISTAIARSRVQAKDDEYVSAIELDEYSDPSEKHVYRLNDIISLLKSAQKGTPAAISELQRVAHEPSGANDVHRQLVIGDTVHCELHTLRTLAGQEVFDVVCDCLTVFVTASERDEVAAEIAAWGVAAAAKDAQDSLWREVGKLKDQGLITLHAVANEPDDEGAEDEESQAGRNFYLDSAKLAQQLGITLIADDRVLQVICLRGDQDGVAAAGSDQVLIAIAESDPRTLERMASLFRRLMRWRYRFLVPRSSFLIQWVRDSLPQLPGDALIDVAAYMHDCLRDPGLHCGMENSDPPMPIAARLVTSWTETIADFLADLWDDSSMSDEIATRLTTWAGEECTPSCPRGMWFHPVGDNLARNEPSIALKMAMVRFATVKDQRRANLGLRTLADALAIDEVGFLTITAEALDAVA